MRHFRNFAVHQYFGTDKREIWNSALGAVAEIEDQIIEIMKQDFLDF